MRRIITLGAVIILLLGPAAGCRQLPDRINRPDHKILVGFAMDTLKEERWQRDKDIFSLRLKELGADIIVEQANNDSNRQLQQINKLIDRHVDVLVIIPHDALKVTSAVIRARKAGIKVVSYDRLIRNAPLDLYVSFDNVKVGELMAEHLTEKIPQGDYVIINGAPTDNNCFMFNDGYKNVLNRPENKKNIRVVFEGWAEDWRPEAAYHFMESLINNKRHFDAVIAANDSLAGAVIEVLAEQRMAGKIPVVGHDADLSGCQRIVEGTQDLTVYKPIQKLATKAAELVYALAKGRGVKPNRRIYNGRYSVPSMIIEPIAINKSNISIVIDDGFHSLKDIYLHIPRQDWPKID